MTSTRENLTENSDNELSLLVFNIERLYKARNWDPILLFNELTRHYIFTGNQWSVLQNDIALDKREQ